MAKVVMTTDPGALQKFMASPQGGAFQLVRRAVEDTDVRAQAWVRRLTTTRTGNLATSHVKSPIVVQGKKIVGSVENTAKYAPFVHDGTRPHPIVARRAKFLHWISPGKPPWAPGPVFVPRVMHPGTEPRPWLKLAATEVGRKHGFIFSEG